MAHETETPVGVDLVIRITSKTEVEAYLTTSGSYPRSAPPPVWTKELIQAANAAALALGMGRMRRSNPALGASGSRRYSATTDDWEAL